MMDDNLGGGQRITSPRTIHIFWNDSWREYPTLKFKVSKIFLWIWIVNVLTEIKSENLDTDFLSGSNRCTFKMDVRAEVILFFRSPVLVT